MNDLRNLGTTHFAMRGSAHPDSARDLLLQAVRDAAADAFEVYGMIGRDARSRLVYLARDLANRKLVALAAGRTRSRNEYKLELIRELDESLSAAEERCPRCGSGLRDRGRYCPQCGVNVGLSYARNAEWTREQLLEAARDAAFGRFEILGELPRAGRRGVVYFARDPDTGKVAMLRLRKDAEASYWLGQTRILKRALAPPPRSRLQHSPAPRQGPERLLAPIARRLRGWMRRWT